MQHRCVLGFGVFQGLRPFRVGSGSVKSFFGAEGCFQGLEVSKPFDGKPPRLKLPPTPQKPYTLKIPTAQEFTLNTS